MHYLSPSACSSLRLPLADIVWTLRPAQSRTRGYASLDYDLIGLRESDLVKLDICSPATDRRAVDAGPPLQGSAAGAC